MLTRKKEYVNIIKAQIDEDRRAYRRPTSFHLPMPPRGASILEWTTEIPEVLFVVYGQYLLDSSEDYSTDFTESVAAEFEYVKKHVEALGFEEIYSEAENHDYMIFLHAMNRPEGSYLYSRLRLTDRGIVEANLKMKDLTALAWEGWEFAQNLQTDPDLDEEGELPIEGPDSPADLP